jgi:hypothetical protein
MLLGKSGSRKNLVEGFLRIHHSHLFASLVVFPVGLASPGFYFNQLAQEAAAGMEKAQ